MLKHCRPDILARGHLSLLHRFLGAHGPSRRVVLRKIICITLVLAQLNTCTPTSTCAPTSTCTPTSSGVPTSTYAPTSSGAPTSTYIPTSTCTSISTCSPTGTCTANVDDICDHKLSCQA